MTNEDIYVALDSAFLDCFGKHYDMPIPECREEMIKIIDLMYDCLSYEEFLERF